MLTRIHAVRNTKTKVEIEGFEHFVAEKMALNHAKIIHRLITNTELDSEEKSEQIK